MLKPVMSLEKRECLRQLTTNSKLFSDLISEFVLIPEED